MSTLRCMRRLFVLSSNCVHIRKFTHYNHKISHVGRRSTFNEYSLRLNKYLSTSKINSSATDNKELSLAFINLDTNYKRQQRIYKNDVESLIKDIENGGLINNNHSVLLLHCCGNLMPDELPSTRISLAQKAWQTFLSKKLELNVEHYNALLQCYIENRQGLSHKEFLRNMKCEPNEQTYQLLLECVCENRDIDQAVEIVNVMKEKGIPANEPVFNSLILGHLLCGDISSSENILATMRIAHMIPSASTYIALLRGYAEIGNLDKFTSTLQSAASREISLKLLILLIHSICSSENLNLLPMVKKMWSSKMDSRIFETKLTSLCVHLVYLKKPEIAYETYKCLVDPEVGFVSESDTYAAFLFHEMVLAKVPSKVIIKIADDLIETGRNCLALLKATEVGLRIPDVELSVELLKALYDRKEALRNHYFWPLLVHEGRLHGEKGIFEIFNLMNQLNVRIEPETLESYSLQYINNLETTLLIDRLKQFNLTVTEVLTPLCVVLLRMKLSIKEVVDLDTKYKVKLDGSKLLKSLSYAFAMTNDVKNTVKLVQAITSKNQSEDWAGQLIFYSFTRSGKDVNYEQILRLLKAYKRAEIKITAFLLDKIDHLCKRIQDKKMKNNILDALQSLDIRDGEDHSHNNIPHPRNMNLEELECHLIELQNKRMDTRGVLRKLIQMHCRVGNVERVAVLCDFFQNAGYKMSTGMKAGLLDLYIKSEQINEAWKIYTEIKESNSTFVVDEFKVVDLATLLISNNSFNEAINLLKKESSNRQIRGGQTIERNCWKLLDLVAKSGNIAETKIAFKTLTKNGFCTESNIILGPLIRVHLCKDNLNEAVEEYLNCCVNYNKTPLVHELLCCLVVDKNNIDLVSKVIESTALVHGVINSQMALAAALAEKNQTNVLRKLFMELTTQLPSSLLEQYCERWVKEGNVQALKNIVSSAEGITRFDLSVVHFSLMRLYNTNNDCDSALSLWNDLQDKHILPSEKVKNLMITLLSNQQHPMARTL